MLVKRGGSRFYQHPKTDSGVRIDRSLSSGPPTFKPGVSSTFFFMQTGFHHGLLAERREKRAVRTARSSDQPNSKKYTDDENTARLDLTKRPLQCILGDTLNPLVRAVRTRPVRPRRHMSGR